MMREIATYDALSSASQHPSSPVVRASVRASDARRARRRVLQTIVASVILALTTFAVSAQEKAPDAKAKVEAVKNSSEDGAPEMTKEASKAIEDGLKFFIATQAKDGSWGKSNHVGLTSLAMMSFMVKGHFPGSGPHADELDRAKEFLMKKATASGDGYIGTNMYEHGLATLAFSEIWGMTKGKNDDKEIQNILELAVDVILRSQAVNGSWTYQPMPNPGDTSISVMQLKALASAKQAGIMVPDENIMRGIKFLRGAHTPAGGFSYTGKGTSGSMALACAGTYALQISGQRESEEVGNGVRHMLEFPDEAFDMAPSYFYMHYYGIHAMVQSSDENYREWYPKIREGLLQRQAKDGSWEGAKGGVPMGTAIAIIILGTPNRYIPIYQR